MEFIEGACQEPVVSSVDAVEPTKRGPTFTIQNTWSGATPLAPIRRGRGTFSHRLRTEEMEQQQRNESTSSVLTGITVSVVLPSSLPAKPTSIAANEKGTSPPAFHKKDIPLNMPPALASGANVGRNNFFGRMFDPEEEAGTGDTVRQLLFRGEKRRRYCVIVGDLQNEKREVVLKLFGHRGNKPFKLQNKLIRMINLSIGKPRVRQCNVEAVDAAAAEGEESGGCKDRLNTEGMKKDDEIRFTSLESCNTSVEKSSQYTVTTTSNYQVGNPTVSGPAGATEPFLTQESIDALNAEINAHHVEPGFLVGTEEIRLSVDSNNGCKQIFGDDDGESCPLRGESCLRSSFNNVCNEYNTIDGVYHHGDVSEHDDVDHYFDTREDEVVPLTVEQEACDQGRDAALAHETGLANSPVLTSRYFATLKDYFLREFRFLLSLEDVQSQNVSVSVNLGAAYCCLARHGSHATPLKHASFIQFVERMNDESMQLYFINDCPTCVSRAVDMECGALHHEVSLTLVKINFFSNERQSRMTARAVWDSEQNAFKLLDMESLGLFFNWTIFSLDESNPGMAKDHQASSGGTPQFGANDNCSRVDSFFLTESAQYRVSPADVNTVTTAASERRKKTVAYPFEVEFRAFRRWKKQNDHPAAALANAILDKLSLAEHNLINYGSSVGYERMDLSHVCEEDYAAEDYNVESIVVEHTARVKPEGTDLLVDNTTSLFIENFAAARQLKELIAQHGPERVAALQKPRNNNFMRVSGVSAFCAGNTRGSSIQNASRRRGHGGMGTPPGYTEEVLRPASKLTFFRSRGSTIHWKFRLGSSVEENLAPMTEAMTFVQQVLKSANNIERNEVRGGAAPEAL